MTITWWSLVVGGRGVHNQLLQGKAVKKTKKGDAVFLKNGDPFLEYIPLHEASSRGVKDFATRNEILNATEKSVKECFNELKTLIRASKYFFVCYHTSSDKLSLCVNNHYHIVLGLDSDRDMDKQYRYRNMRKAAGGDGPITTRQLYCSYQRVKSLEGLIKYLSRKPRVLYGSNYRQFIEWYHEEMGSELPTMYNDTFLEDVQPCDVLGDVAEEADELGYGPLDLITDSTSFDDVPMKRTYKEWEEDDVGVVEHKKQRKDEGASYIARLIEMLCYIMLTTRTTDKILMRRHIDQMVKLGNPEGHNMLARFKNITYNRQVGRIWENGTQEYRAAIHRMTFGELCVNAWQYLRDCPEYEQKYIPLHESVQLLLTWLSEAGIPPKKFLENCYSVMKRTSGKLNTVFCMGRSNAGKTVMFSKPLEFIAQCVGRIVSLNVSDRFVFEGCAGQKLISIEECLVPKQHQEEIKKLMGGENCQVDVKYCREGVLLSATPVIATSNQAPWTLDYALEEPLRNRMYYYEFHHTFPSLELWINKELDPRAYILCWSLIKDGVHLPDLYDDTVLQAAIDTVDAITPTPRGPCDELDNYSLHSKDSFVYNKAHICGYLGDVPVINPCLFGAKETKQFPAVQYVVAKLSTCPSDFWVHDTRVIQNFRICIRFVNCAIGCPLTVYAEELIDGETVNRCFEEWLSQLQP